MKLKIYQVDAFTKNLFGGNPAAVIPLTQWLTDEVMQDIAAENNLSETVFYVPRNDGSFHIRWFTPTIEVMLCGHATLATAHVMFKHLKYPHSEITFDSLSGILRVRAEADGGYTLDFPADQPTRATLPEIARQALNVNPIEVYQGKEDYMIVLATEAEVRDLMPDFKQLSAIKARGFIVTARGENCDFVSRCFFPASGIDEDPVTGSAHTTLTPYWAEKLMTNRLFAKQISKRGGELHCKYVGRRIEISGHARTYLVGDIDVE
jgi:PhzF family phenazine biosynthesis protein